MRKESKWPISSTLSPPLLYHSYGFIKTAWTVKCSRCRTYYFCCSNDSALWRVSILYHPYLIVTGESVKSDRENGTGSFFKLHILHCRLLWPSTFLESTTKMQQCMIMTAISPIPIFPPPI